MNSITVQHKVGDEVWFHWHGKPTTVKAKILTMKNNHGGVETYWFVDKELPGMMGGLHWVSDSMCFKTREELVDYLSK